MATIGSMIVNLGLNKKGFDTGLGGAAKNLAGFGAKARKTIGKIAGLASGLAGLAGVAGFGIMTKEAFGTIDAAAKLSDQIGISTEKLVGLQHAATLTGTSQDTLNSGMQKFARTLGDAKQGLGAGVAAFEQLGISVDSLAGKNPDQAFLEVADAIKSLPTPFDKASAAAAIFGRKGQEMLSLFETGSKGINEMIRDAEQLGVTFNRTDAAKIEQANDAMFRMKQSIMGATQQFAIGLAPAIEFASNAVTKFSAHSAQSVGQAFGLATSAIVQWEFTTELAVASMEYQFARLGSTIYHTFITQGGEALSWFGRKFGLTILGMTEVVATGGKSGWYNLLLQPMSEGFNGALNDLKFSERPITHLEMQLQKRMKTLAEKLADGMNGEFEKTTLKLPEFKLPELPDIPGIAGGGGGSTSQSKAEPAKGPRLLEKGSKEAVSAILKAQLASSSPNNNDISKKSFEELQKQTRNGKKQLEVLEKLRGFAPGGQQIVYDIA